MWIWYVAAAVVVLLGILVVVMPRRGGIEGRMREVRRDAQGQAHLYRGGR